MHDRSGCAASSAAATQGPGGRRGDARVDGPRRAPDAVVRPSGTEPAGDAEQLPPHDVAGHAAPRGRLEGPEAADVALGDLQRPADAGRRRASRPRVGFEVLRVSALTPADWEAVWALVAEFFEVDRGYTEPMLRAREYIVLFRAADDPVLAGMSTFDVLPVEHGGRRVVAIYSSYVLLRDAYRGLNLVQKSGFASFLRVKRRHPLTPVLWFFYAFSIKSYLLLPRNFDIYWPRHDAPTPAWEAALMDRLARTVHGPLWQPARGVALRSGRERLRPGVAPLPSPAERSPDVAFFAARNPGHEAGDVLVCLAPLSPANWCALARRALRRAQRAVRRP